MSVLVMGRVWATSKQEGGTLLVLLAMADFANDEGVCWPSVGALAKKARLKERAVQYALKKLRAEGEVDLVKQGGYEDGKPRSNLYRVKGAISAPSTEEGCTEVRERVQPGAPQPSKEPSSFSNDEAVVQLFPSSSQLSTSKSSTVMPEVREVFEHWKLHTGRNGRTKLDAKRTKVIKKALVDYPKADLLAAVRGWKYSPHHCGENDSGKVYNDLELLLRDAKHIEAFRDLAFEADQRAQRTSAWERERDEALGVGQVEW